MIALLAFFLCMYLLVFCVVFVAYDGHEKLATRAKISAIAPFLLAVGGVAWAVERMEELG